MLAIIAEVDVKALTLQDKKILRNKLKKHQIKV